MRHAGGRRVQGGVATAVLAGVATALVLAGLAVAETHRTDQQPAQTREPEAAASPAPTPDPEAALTPGLAPDGPEPRRPRRPRPPPAPSPRPNQTPRPPPTSPDAAAETPSTDPPAATTPEPARPPPRPRSPTPPSTDPPAATTPEPAPPTTDPPAATTPEPAPDATVPPSADAAASPATAPDAFVRAYYDNLNAKRFKAAWATLSPAVQKAFGDFDGWRDGYATTLSSTPSAIEVDGASVTHVLVASDRGCPERRFRVRWRLQPAGDEWTVAALSASALDSIVCR